MKTFVEYMQHRDTQLNELNILSWLGQKLGMGQKPQTPMEQEYAELKKQYGDDTSQWPGAIRYQFMRKYAGSQDQSTMQTPQPGQQTNMDSIAARGSYGDFGNYRGAGNFGPPRGGPNGAR